MVMRRFLAVIMVLGLFVTMPALAGAQNFPSQQGGGGGSQGGFPSQGDGGFGSQGRGGVYQSTIYGFSLNVLAPWEILEQAGGPGENFEGVVLSNGTSVVTFLGVEDSSTPQVIVENAAANLGSPMTFLEALVDEPDMAAAFYISDDEQMGARVFAARMSPTSAFVIVWLFPAAQFETEVEQYNALIDGLQF